MHVSKEELQRQRSALYSRRSFNKRKLEILTLQNQVTVLQINKERMQRQNAELEKALAAAKGFIPTDFCIANENKGGGEAVPAPFSPRP